MRMVNIHDAKTHLSKLVEAAANGEEIVISKAGKAMAKIVPFINTPKRKPGLLKGKIKIPKEFFDPELDEKIIKLFEGEK